MPRVGGWRAGNLSEELEAAVGGDGDCVRGEVIGDAEDGGGRRGRLELLEVLTEAKRVECGAQLEQRSTHEVSVTAYDEVIDIHGCAPAVLVYHVADGVREQ